MAATCTCIADRLLQGAIPGGPYENTLLLVMSDHGQTLGGDHGGGSSDEVDSILVAANLRRMQRGLRTQGDPAKEPSSSSPAADIFQHLHRSSCKPGAEGGNSSSGSNGGSGVNATATATCAGGALTQALVCSSSIPQIDFTATVAQLLGVPVPFGNLGKVPPLLWAVLAEPNVADATLEGESILSSGAAPWESDM
jgi:phosphatidylinositol glycan class O